MTTREKSKIYDDYVKLYGDEMSTSALSKLIIKDHPDITKNQADHGIRYRKGQNGDKNRKHSGHIKMDYFDHQARIQDISKKAKEKELKRLNQKGGARILVYDIETAPVRAYVWRMWKENIGTNQIISDWFMLTWSAKWLFEDGVMSDKITPKEVKNEDDKRICKSLWALFEEADIVIAHNALKFDNKRMNTRWIMNGMTLPSPYQTIDTLVHARKKFSFNHNRLDYLAKQLGVGRKIDTGGFELWERCMNGEQKAIDEMEIYNIHDVRILEDVYLKMRPYIQPHPNIGLFIKDNVKACPTCGHEELEWSGTYNTYANSFDAFRCKNCGAIGRSRNTNLDTESKRFLQMSVPR